VPGAVDEKSGVAEGAGGGGALIELREGKMSEKIYLEDLQVGQKFSSAAEEMTEAEILAFAARYDPQPFHLDDEAAKGTLFGGLAASGWHTAAFTMRLNVTSGPKFAGGIVGGGGEISWPMPTRPGDVLHVESEVVEVTPSRSKPDRGMVVLLSNTVNQDGKVVQVSRMKLVVPKRGDD
jgi:acyl dehydratase